MGFDGPRAADRRPPTRFEVLRGALLRPLWVVVYALWSALTFAKDVVEFVSPTAADRLPALVGFIPVDWWLPGLLLLALGASWEGSYRRAVRDYGELATVRGRLVEALTPRLEIQFSGDSPSLTHKEAHYILRRIGVHNPSSRTVHGARVQLVRINPHPEELRGLPLPLHLMNDNSQPFRDRFDVAPGEIVFIDLAYHLGRSGPSYARIPHIVSGIKQDIPFQSYEVTVRVTADDLAPTERTLRLDARDDFAVSEVRELGSDRLAACPPRP